MNIEGSRILVLGGWGLVGSAICRKLMEFSPAELIVSSLKQTEAEDAIEQLRREYPEQNPEMFSARWGNIFTRTEWKDIDFKQVLSNPETRKKHIKDIFYELSDSVVNNSALYELITETKPDIVIDCINTATAIAYLDIYNTTINAIKRMEENLLDESLVENIMASDYIPQLIRHIQLIYKGLCDANTKMYFKVGTSGTGGMGFNIPYTHSEERPSRVLLSKTAVAGAQTLLLFLLARTPNGPLVKEIKPTAAIAWKKIAFGDVKRRGQTIKLVDMPYNEALPIGGDFVFDDNEGIIDTGNLFQSVFIDTGENGIFSRGEFQAISALGQMEIITPEEIAEYLVHEIRGGNTGKDIIQGLDAFTMGPTYRGGMLRNVAMKKIDELEKIHEVDSVAFELLGPPRLSKLLYEGYLLRKIVKGMKNLNDFDSKDISLKAAEIVKSNEKLRAQMLSIGLVILLPDGKSYLRGGDVKIPVRRGDYKLEMTGDNIEQWCYDGWMDLRESNWDNWKMMVDKIMDFTNKLPKDDTSSRFTYTMDYWDNFDGFDEGKIVGWIFENEDKGWRFKR